MKRSRRVKKSKLYDYYSENGEYSAPIDLKSSLTAKQIAIVNGEFQKRKKSAAIAYLLWVFFCGLGLHRLYLGLNTWLIFPAFIILSASFFLGGLYSGTLIFATVLSLCSLWDLFSIPGMTSRRNDEIEEQIIEEL